MLINPYALAAAGGGGGGPDLTNVEALLRFEAGLLTDDTGSVWTATSGPPTIVTATAAEGAQCADFSAANTYLQTDPSDTLWKMDGAFTVELWYYPTSTTGFSHLFTARHAASSPPATVGPYIYTNGTAVISNLAGTTIEAAALTLNAWNHIALVRTALAGTNNCNLYVNGIWHKYGTNNTAYGAGAHYMTLRVGYDPSVTAARLKGYADFFRFTKAARYTGAFTPPTTA